MDIFIFLWFFAGLALLVFGADLLVKGASKIAIGFGISPLIIGLTIVSFGTSAPEMAVSVSSAFAGESASGSGADIVLGNVVGSNIFNVLFILGISALIIPLYVNRHLIRLDVPIMIGSSILLLLMSFDGVISIIDGILFFLGLITYTYYLIRQSRKEQRDISQEGKIIIKKNWLFYAKHISQLVIGLAMLVIGSGWLVDSAVTFALTMGISKLVVGLTIVSVGTSLPELATSVIAAIRGERDIAVGNVVGSNIFNILAVLGMSAIVSPSGIAVSPSALSFDIPIMIAFAFACLPIFFTGFKISRWEGFIFLVFYIAYMIFIVLTATKNSNLPVFTSTMISYVLPITAITFIVLSIRSFSNDKNRENKKNKLKRNK